MPRLGMGLGLNTLSKIYGGGSSIPSGYTGRYITQLSYMGLVGGDAMQTWADASEFGNDLTQETSGEQPTFVEGYRGVGDEKVTNGDFSDGTNDWTPEVNGILSIVDDSLSVTVNTSSAGRAIQGISTVVGELYKLKADFINANSNTVLVGVSNNSDGGGAFKFETGTNASGSFDYQFTAQATTTYISLSRSNNSTTEILYDNISVKLAQRDTSLDSVYFDTSDNMDGLVPNTGDLTYVFKGITVEDNATHHNLLSLDGVSSTGLWINLSGTFLTIYDGAVKQLSISSPLWGRTVDIVLRYSAGVYQAFIDGSAEGSATGTPINVNTLGTGESGGSINGSIQGEVINYPFALTDEQIAEISPQSWDDSSTWDDSQNWQD